MSEVTCILSAIEQGDRHAAEQLLPHTGLVSTMAFLDGRTLITGSRDCTIKFWDLTKLEETLDR